MAYWLRKVLESSLDGIYLGQEEYNSMKYLIMKDLEFLIHQKTFKIMKIIYKFNITQIRFT